MPTGLGSRPTFSCSHPRGSNDRIHRGRRDRAAREWVFGCSRSPLPVVRENVISGLHDRVAREPALGVVPLRRLVSQGAGLNAAHPHPPLSANLLLSFTMKSTSCRLTAP